MTCRSRRALNSRDRTARNPQSSRVGQGDDLRARSPSSATPPMVPAYGHVHVAMQELSGDRSHEAIRLDTAGSRASAAASPCRLRPEDGAKGDGHRGEENRFRAPDQARQHGQEPAVECQPAGRDGPAARDVQIVLDVGQRVVHHRNALRIALCIGKALRELGSPLGSRGRGDASWVPPGQGDTGRRPKEEDDHEADGHRLRTGPRKWPW